MSVPACCGGPPHALLMVLPVRLETLRAFAAKEAVPEMTVAVRDIVTTARIMPVGENVLSATHKEQLVDCPGGEMLVMAALPSGTVDGKCSKTWCAVVALADKDGRVIVRGFKGSALTVLLTASSIDMSVEAGYPDCSGLLDPALLARARQRAIDALPSQDVDQAPPPRPLAGEVRVLLEWPRTMCAALASSGSLR